MPPSLSAAMGIALYCMFIAIIIPPARDNKNVMISVVMATAGSVLFACVPFLNALSGGWSIIIVSVIVSALCAVWFPLTEEK